MVQLLVVTCAVPTSALSGACTSFDSTHATPVAIGAPKRALGRSAANHSRHDGWLSVGGATTGSVAPAHGSSEKQQTAPNFVKANRVPYVSKSISKPCGCVSKRAPDCAPQGRRTRRRSCDVS